MVHVVRFADIVEIEAINTDLEGFKMRRRLIRKESKPKDASSPTISDDYYFDNYGDRWKRYYGSPASLGTNQTIRTVDRDGYFLSIASAS